MMRKVFRKIHLWLSIPFGLIVSIICLSGAILVFEKEVMELLRHDLYHVAKVENQTVPLEQLMAQVAETLPESVTISGVTLYSSPDRAYQVALSKPRRASLYVDQYTGEIKGRNERAAFFTFMFKTHRWLLDSANPNGGIFWGKMIVGVSTLMFLFVLLSGIVVWIPRNYKALRNRLTITVRKGLLRFLHDLHVAGGIYAVILLLIMALTGLTWSFSWCRTGVYTLFGVEATTTAHHTPQVCTRDKERKEDRFGNRVNAREHGGGTDHNYVVWSKICAELSRLHPDFEAISVSDGRASVSVKRFGNQRAADSYAFDRRSGEITEMVNYRDSALSSKLRGWIFSLHVGSWGGLFSKIVTFLAALIGVSLPLTGYYIWLRRLCRKKRSA